MAWDTVGGVCLKVWADRETREEEKFRGGQGCGCGGEIPPKNQNQLSESNRLSWLNNFTARMQQNDSHSSWQDRTGLYSICPSSTGLLAVYTYVLP